MMFRAGALALALALGATAAIADENADLNLIPEAAREPGAAASPGANGAHGRIYVENAATFASLRSDLPAPLPPPSPADWQERLFLDAREHWALAQGLGLDYSGRLNFRADDRIAVPTHENIRHDFREGFVTWTPRTGVFLDAGRINLKSGVAAGYNPTDFFKTHAVVEPTSLDPTVLREDRLGAAMIRASFVAEAGALTVAFAPSFEKPSPIFSAKNLPSFDPMFGRTNAHDRLLVKGNAKLGRDFSPEFLFYREGARTRWGANLTQAIGRKTVSYLEWSGGERTSLIDEALRYGRSTGTIPGFAPSVLPENSGANFRNELSLGASYATEYNVTFNLEYHYNGAAFSHQDWRNWFAIGATRAGLAGVAGQLWYIRSYALDIQQPLARHSVFLRFNWVDAFVPKLELTGFTSTDLYDGSTIAQLTADYYLSNVWTVGAIAAANLGSRRSEFGSLPQAQTLLFKLARYL
jgi:hypothetical protein